MVVLQVSSAALLAKLRIVFCALFMCGKTSKIYSVGPYYLRHSSRFTQTRALHAEGGAVPISKKVIR